MQSKFVKQKTHNGYHGIWHNTGSMGTDVGTDEKVLRTINSNLSANYFENSCLPWGWQKIAKKDEVKQNNL